MVTQQWGRVAVATPVTEDETLYLMEGRENGRGQGAHVHAIMSHHVHI